MFVTGMCTTKRSEDRLEGTPTAVLTAKAGRNHELASAIPFYVSQNAVGKAQVTDQINYKCHLGAPRGDHSLRVQLFSVPQQMGISRYSLFQA